MPWFSIPARAPPSPRSFFPAGANGSCTGLSNIAPVGTPSLGAGLWGQLDMSGGVYGWTMDWLAASLLAPRDRSLFATPTTPDTAVGARCAREP